jgi:integrase
MAALALEFLIVTATRTAETLGMQWDEIDRDNAVWVVPGERMKTGEEFSVPLSDRAAEIIAEARSRARKEPTADRFVFFGVIPKRPLSNMALSMLMRRMSASVTVHGFRTSFRTWASEVGRVEFEIAESCLSHRVGNAVSRAYNRSNLLERRRPVMAS